MKYKIRWAQEVLDKIRKQKDYIAYDSPKAAKLWARSIKEKQLLIKENPFIGRVVPEFNVPNYREVIVGNYRLVYVVEDAVIDIVEIRNCKENLTGE